MFNNIIVISPIKATRRFLIHQLHSIVEIQNWLMAEESSLSGAEIGSMPDNQLIIADISVMDDLRYCRHLLRQNDLLVILTAKEAAKGGRWEKGGYQYSWLARPFSTANLKKAIESLGRPQQATSAHATAKASPSGVTGIRY